MEIAFASFVLLGAVIGYIAAYVRGYSTVAGIIGGALLGILSPLLFCVSGVVKSEEKRHPCSKCKEKIIVGASVCPFCKTVF